MGKTFRAIFDGKVLCPEEPIKLKPNTRVLITIENTDIPKKAPYSFFRTAKSLKLKGPSDWSARLDDYLYGKEKDDAKVANLDKPCSP